MSDNKYKDKNNNVNMPSTAGGFGRRNMAPVVKPKNFRKTIKRLWSYFGAERKTLIMIFIFIFAVHQFDAW